jgi:hypothetical protein
MKNPTSIAHSAGQGFGWLPAGVRGSLPCVVTPAIAHDAPTAGLARFSRGRQAVAVDGIADVTAALRDGAVVLRHADTGQR